MTVAVSAAIQEGAEAVICASTGNTAASAAAYAARAGLRGAVIVPEGKIATGKLAQALMHGARVIALRGNFDEALALVRQLTDRHPIALVNSVNDFRIEGQKTGAFEVCDELGEAPDVLCIPVGNAGNVTSWWKGFQEYGVAPAMHGYQAEGAAPLVQGAPVEAPETVASAIRIGNPARWENAMSAFTTSRGEVRAVSDAEILAAYTLLGTARGGVLRAGVGGVGGGAAALRGRGPRGVRADRARAEGPADRDEPGGVGGAVRAEHRAASSGPCWDEAAPARTRAGVVGEPRARLRRARRGARDRAGAGGRGDRLVRGRVRRAGGAARPLQPVRARVRAAAPRGRRALLDPLGDPAGGRARVERGGDRGGRGGGRSHVRAGRATVRAGGGARGPPRQRGGGAARGLRRLRSTHRSGSGPPPAWRASSRSRASRCLLRRRGRRCLRRCRCRTPWPTSAPCLC